MRPTTLLLLLMLPALFAPADAAAKKKKRGKKDRDAPAVAAPEAPAQSPPATAMQGPGGEGPVTWDDPAFRSAFLGTYGVNSEIEPAIGPVERERLEEVLPLLGEDLDGAAAALEGLVGPEASALFDFTLANVRFQQQELGAAAESYRAAIDKFPAYRRAHQNLGLIEVREGRFESALEHLSRVVQLGGGDGLVYGLLGYSYSATEQHVAAESAYRNALLLQPDQLDWKLGLTQSVLKQEKWEEAAALTGELLRRFPDETDYWLLQANAWIGMGRPLRAAENYEIVERMGEASAAVLNTLGDIYVNESLWDLAVRAYSEAVERDSAAAMGSSLQRVEYLAQRGALEAAGRLLRQVRRHRESVPDAEERKRLLKLEARIALARGEGGDAVSALEGIVALDPLDGEALLLLGQHHAQRGYEEQALFLYERAAGLGDHEADAKLRQGQLLVTMGRYGEALPILKRALELEPRDDVADYVSQVERVARGRR
jgi:tetratricopeptide (TPR) repeat protein